MFIIILTDAVPDAENLCSKPTKKTDIIDQVTGELRKEYSELREMNEEDEWPPNQPRTIVNVALIHYKGRRTKQELIEISKRHKRGTAAVDELVNECCGIENRNTALDKQMGSSPSHSRITKNITDIFAAEISPTEIAACKFGNPPPKCILIEGAPGIGKTVLAKEISFLWAKNCLLENVSVLLLLFLRDPELREVDSEIQLVQYLLKSVGVEDLSDQQVVTVVKKLKEMHVCVLMDGYDEYPADIREKSFIAKLVKRRIFPNSIVVITSRPTATLNLHDQVDRRIEVLGFAQRDRDEYISNSLKQFPDKQKDLTTYLKYHPIINSLIYVPLHLAVLLYLFKVQSKLPKTLTEMNESFILHTIFRSLSKQGAISSVCINTAFSDLKKLPKPVYDTVCQLSELAYGGMHNSQLVFTYDEIKNYCPEIEDIPGALNGFGLLQVVQHFALKGPGKTASFNFLHYTMQEFLAAFYVANLESRQQLALLKTTFWESKYNFMWMMYVGINRASSQSFTQFLYRTHSGGKKSLAKHITTNKPKCLHLFQCFMESNSEIVPKEIASLFYNEEINFRNLRLHPHHISSLLSYISKYNVQIRTLDLRNCHVGDIGMNLLKQFFIMHPEKALSIEKLDLFGNDSILLFDVYCTILQPCGGLRKLNWSSLGQVDNKEIITFLSSAKSLITSLNISENHLKDNLTKELVDVLCGSNTLQDLDISNNGISNVGAIEISKSLKYLVKLRHLIMSWNSHTA